VVAAGIAWYFLSPSPTPSIAPTLVSTVTVQETNLPLTVQADGSIIAPNSLTLKAQQAGVIKTINFNSGAYVKQGQVLFTLDDTTEKGELLKAQAAFDLDKSMYDRFETLWQQGEISQADYDAAQSKFRQDRGALNEALYQEAQTKITAPFSGNVGATNLAVGSVVAVGDSLVDLVDRNDLVVEYSVPQDLLGEVQLGQAVSFTSDAYPAKTFNAVVSYISPQIDQSTGSVTLRAKVDNSANLLIPGLLVHITQVLNPNYKALAIPVISLMGDISGYQVYTVVNGKVNNVNVTVGERVGDLAVITQGLNPGDKVIVAGQEKVKTGSLVSISS
jgi:RND family efflux transporter MFP subunit